jgi:hypothetical protein
MVCVPGCYGFQFKNTISSFLAVRRGLWTSVMVSLWEGPSHVSQGLRLGRKGAHFIPALLLPTRTQMEPRRHLAILRMELIARMVGKKCRRNWVPGRCEAAVSPRAGWHWVGRPATHGGLWRWGCVTGDFLEIVVKSFILTKSMYYNTFPKVEKRKQDTFSNLHKDPAASLQYCF